MTEQEQTIAKAKDLAFLMVQYQVLADRNNQHNSLLWSVPSLLFLAQSFLWTVAVQEQYALFVRVLLSGLSVLISIASLQLFFRTKLMEISISMQLQSIEREMQNRCYPSLIASGLLKDREILEDGCEVKMEERFKKEVKLFHFPIFQLQSNQVWMVIMTGAFLISLGLFLWLTLPKVLPILQGWLIH